MGRNTGILFRLHVSATLAMACNELVQISWTESNVEALHNYHLDPPETHMKILSFYHENRRPPLMEAYLLHKAPESTFEKAKMSCFGLTFMLEMIIAEAELLVSANSRPIHDRFVRMWNELHEMNSDARNDVMRLWPIAVGAERINLAISNWEGRRRLAGYLSVTFVICHCRESLSSLIGNITEAPVGSKLLIYEKCGSDVALDDLATFGRRFGGGIEIIHQQDGPVRGDECTGYLDYIVKNYESLSDFTVFLQGDADHHMFLSFLNTALKGIKAGQYDIGFLHLNFHRHYQTTTPCMRDVERVLFNLPAPVEPVPLIGTYCCAQFIVRRDRILARERRFYEDAFLLVNGSTPDLCSPTPPKRSSHCYVLEYLWHTVFGEPRYLPHKPDDDRLPLLLRMKYGNENSKCRWDDVPLRSHTTSILNRTVDIGMCLN